MKSMRSLQKGFTLMELLVVVAIIAVLMGITAAAVTGTKSQSTEGQVKSDGKATQTAGDNFNNKSIETGKFPEVQPDSVVATAGSSFHIYADVFRVAPSTGSAPTTASGDNVILVRRNDGKGETLADKKTPSGLTTSSAVYARTFIDFTTDTNTYDKSGAVKTSTFVPDFLQKLPTSLSLKGDETKDLGGTGNTFEEYLWLMLVNAAGSDEESRTVEVYRMSAADCSRAVSENSIITGRVVFDPTAISSGDVATLKSAAADCDSTDDVVNALVYDRIF